jgi:hypothetical protein
MRLTLIATAIAAAMLLDPWGAQAYEGPWCAVTEIRGGTIQTLCSMRSLDMCQQEVIAGNRGFCNPWQGNPAGRQKPARRARPV